MSAIHSRIAVLLGAVALGAAAPEAAPVEQRIAADEARQGAASDGRFVYAIDNSRIGKYRIADGRRVAQWVGDPIVYPHLNSCTMVRRELVCASSNYPALPQASSVEVFDRGSLRHLRSHSFGITDGSLTALDRHAGAWWATFAQYDAKGGMPGLDHRSTRLTKLDDAFRPVAGWTFPSAVLERLAPHSVSGMSWSDDGVLAISGHDRPEIYLMALPDAGTVLRLVATVPVVTEGQAIDWDPSALGRLWSITRTSREMVRSDLRAALALTRNRNMVTQLSPR